MLYSIISIFKATSTTYLLLREGDTVGFASFEQGEGGGEYGG